MIGNTPGIKFRNMLVALLLVLGGQSVSPQGKAVAAPPDDPPGPDRIATITADFTAYTWWMATWDNNTVECSIEVDHEGQPTPGDILRDCGEAIYTDYMEQPPCYAAKHNSSCEGDYVYLVDSKVSQREITVKLPPPTVWVSLEGCDSVTRAGTNICERAPILVLQGEEPLPDQHIDGVQGTFDGTPFTCDPTCRLELSATHADGADVQFWAWSSYGDSTPVFDAQVRVAPADVNNPDQTSWYADVLSTQWQGTPNASCSETWDSLPPVGGPPAWLSTPADQAELSSDIPYNYLSANLILQGAVDASACPDGGLLPDGGANTCGQEAARDAVDQWQNQFDALILTTAQDTGVPAQLLKNLFARESQFWPGVFKASADAGLGQLTENGADTTLLWNPSFYGVYCPLVLSADACSQGYLHLETDQQKLLRQALVSSVNATCDNCALGIDLSQADFSVGVFAHTLLASCEQTGQVIYNTVNQTAGQVASYEDLWKLTLVNYNAGPGCLSLVVNDAWNADHALAWDTLSTHFTDTCAPAKDYVNDISQ